MNEQKIRFEDGEGYERMMGKWSHPVGENFLNWLRPEPGRKWLDVGCGNGAFTELIAERCAPSAIDGIDPSDAQLAFARARHARGVARYHQGDAQSLPFADSTFDLAVMALVIFFVPDPARGVAEMVRVVKAGGRVASYAWDMPGGGFPMEPIMQEIQAAGLPPPRPPQPDVSALDALRQLWTDAGLKDVEACEIPVTRSFESFDDYWSASMSGSAGQVISKLLPRDAENLKARVMTRMSAPAAGTFSCAGRANAVKGLVLR